MRDDAAVRVQADLATPVSEGGVRGVCAITRTIGGVATELVRVVTRVRRALDIHAVGNGRFARGGAVEAGLERAVAVGVHRDVRRQRVEGTALHRRVTAEGNGQVHTELGMF
ncbi:hypothetical protein D3C72_840910 [compost metagenome]